VKGIVVFFFAHLGVDQEKIWGGVVLVIIKTFLIPQLQYFFNYKIHAYMYVPL